MRFITIQDKKNFVPMFVAKSNILTSYFANLAKNVIGAILSTCPCSPTKKCWKAITIVGR